MFIRYFFHSLPLLALVACQPAAEQADLSAIWLDNKHQVVILDAPAAAKAIVLDTTDGFFDQIGALDMQLQLGSAANLPPDSLLAHYRRALQAEATNFDATELGLVSSAAHRAFAIVDGRLPGLFPAVFRVAKIQGKAYGPSAYFTREDVIFIPEPELAGNNPDYLADLLIHEIWHLISRRHPEIRPAVYAAFGFAPLPAGLRLDSAWTHRLLRNPDALDLNWGIRLQLNPDSAVVAVPLTYSDVDQAADGRRFMAHFAFDYFPADSTAQGWRLRTEAPLAAMRQPDFIRLTGGNTPYIIHPEEIAADNLVLLAKNESPNLSPDGQAALQRFEAALWAWVKSQKSRRAH